MSTSYIKLNLFLAGIIISSPAFAQSKNLECSWEPFGVPALVIIEDVSALLKKEKKSSLAELLAEKKNENCRPGPDLATCAQATCPKGKYYLCAKNTQYNLDPNHPSDMPNGTESGCLTIGGEELAKYGLHGSLERHPLDFDQTRYGSDSHGVCRRSFMVIDDTLPPPSLGEPDKRRVTHHVCSADNEQEIGFAAFNPLLPYHPEPPIPPLAEKKEPPKPTEDYPDFANNSMCDTKLDCEAAKKCLDDKASVLNESCGGPDCTNRTLAGCSKDYENFCSASGLCGNQTKQFTPEMMEQVQSGLDGIKEIKAATQDDPQTKTFSKCALFKIMTIPVPHQPEIDPEIDPASYQEYYTKCTSGDSDLEKKAHLAKMDLDYLRKVLKAFQKPADFHDGPFDPKHLDTLAKALSKLANTDAKRAFKELGVNNPTEAMLKGYSDLAKAASDLVGKTATKATMEGTVFGFAIGSPKDDTEGGKGYLGIAPQQNASGIQKTYPQIIAAMNEKAYCLRTYTDSTNQEKLIKAIVRDHRIAVAIKKGLDSCPKGGGVNTKDADDAAPSTR